MYIVTKEELKCELVSHVVKCCNHLLVWLVWQLGDCGMCGCKKKSKHIGMGIRKSIVVSFLSCLDAFWGFHPYMSFHAFL